MKVCSWNVTVDGQSYSITSANKKEVTVNGQEMAITSLQTVFSSGGVKAYEIPLGSKKALLYTPGSSQLWDLVIDGKEVITGEDYKPNTIEWWSLVFIIPYLFNFLFICAGAVGGGIFGGGVICSVNIIRNKTLTLGKKIATCILFYVIFTIVEIVIVLAMRAIAGI